MAYITRGKALLNLFLFFYIFSSYVFLARPIIFSNIICSNDIIRTLVSGYTI